MSECGFYRGSGYFVVVWVVIMRCGTEGVCVPFSVSCFAARFTGGSFPCFLLPAGVGCKLLARGFHAEGCDAETHLPNRTSYASVWSDLTLLTADGWRVKPHGGLEYYPFSRRRVRQCSPFPVECASGVARLSHRAHGSTGTAVVRRMFDGRCCARYVV